jgi:rubrerythrin
MAIKNEERSEHLNVSTADSVEDPQLKKLLLVLGKEETKHKKKLEKIYDDEVLTEF